MSGAAGADLPAPAPPPRLTPWTFVTRVTAGVLAHESMGSSAQIAYYLLFATFPCLFTLASLLAFLPVPDLMGRLLGALGSIVPPAAVDLMRDSVERLVTRQRSGFFSVALVVTVWAAANAAEAIMQGLNRVHGLREFRPFWKTRGIALVMAVVAGLLAVLGLLVLWFGAHVSGWWAARGGLGPLPVQFWIVARWPLVLLLLVGAIDQLYYFGPAAELRWRWVTPGAVVAVLGWVAASLGFSLYVRHFGSYNATYGSIGAVVILLTWMYLSAFFILLGAEVNVVTGQGLSRATR